MSFDYIKESNIWENRFFIWVYISFYYFNEINFWIKIVNIVDSKYKWVINIHL